MLAGIERPAASQSSLRAQDEQRPEALEIEAELFYRYHPSGF